jgi:UDP-sulfoquinovose synthase
MRVLVLGGDGYLGWPAAMYFSARDHDVVVVDNYVRRQGHAEVGSDSLTPIAASLRERVDAWREITGREIGVVEGDLLDWDTCRSAFERARPEAVIHFGEIPSNPYSMISREHALLTQANNVLGTLNVIYALKEVAPEAHLLKLGSLHTYGFPDIDIEEGFIDIEHRGRTARLPFPTVPGSWYQCSKSHDSTNLYFAVRNWGLRATDLQQGLVYGITTDETELDPRLATRFDYDDTFGTVLNRFCVQSLIGHPLTVYGSGRQVRGYINIRDTMQCIELAMHHPAAPGEYRVFNQLTEIFSVQDVAALVSRAAREYDGRAVDVITLRNPRSEQTEHYYNPIHTKLLDLGLRPRLLSETLVQSMFAELAKHLDRVDASRIMPSTDWSEGDPSRPATRAALAHDHG